MPAGRFWSGRKLVWLGAAPVAAGGGTGPPGPDRRDRDREHGPRQGLYTSPVRVIAQIPRSEAERALPPGL